MPIGDFLRWIGSFIPDAPYARLILWTVVGAGAALLVVVLYQRLRTGKWRLPRRRAPASGEAEPEDEWAPSPQSAGSWLEEADALAAKGRYAEAVHCLLFRSIEDINRRRPQLVRPALTSREIGAAAAIPDRARELFTHIVGVVERSLFGGRPVGPADWSATRQVYADFALPQVWRR